MHVYVDDIIFGSTNENTCKEFSDLMQIEFEMSMVGELIYFFVDLQIKHVNGIFIIQEKYVKDLLKKFRMNDAKIVTTLMNPPLYSDRDENGKCL